VKVGDLVKGLGDYSLMSSQVFIVIDLKILHRVKQVRIYPDPLIQCDNPELYGTGSYWEIDMFEVVSESR